MPDGTNPYNLSDQDMQDLQQIQSGLQPSDPRYAKITTLLASRPRGGAGGTWEPESAGPIRAVKAFGQQIMQNAANPYGVSMATGAPVDINNPPQLQWNPPRSVGEFLTRVTTPWKNEMQQVANVLTGYVPRSQGDYWTAGGQIAANLVGALPQGPPAEQIPYSRGLGTGLVTEPATIKWGGYAAQDPRYFGQPYSALGDKLAAAVKPVSGLDMPALANATIPSLQESFADLGANPAAFTGRAGTRLFKTVVQHAINIHEDRAAQVMAPIINNPTPPELLANAPDLVSYIGKDPTDITNADVNAARSELNKQLGRGNYFLKSPSKQLNAPESQIDALNAAGQARNILYGQAQDATGIDLNPTRQSEGRLINLNDSATATHNALSQEQARFETAGPLAKVGGLARYVMQAKTPLGAALQATERPTTFVAPTENFNNVMRDIFTNVQPQIADRTFKGGIRAPGMISFVTPGTARMLPANVSGYNTGYQLPPSSAPAPTFEPPGYQY